MTSVAGTLSHVPFILIINLFGYITVTEETSAAQLDHVICAITEGWSRQILTSYDMSFCAEIQSG